MDETIKESETTLEHATTLVGMSGGTIVLLNVIEEMKHSNGCDLVVHGTHGRRGVDRLLLGSDAEQVARIAPVPVMLVRKKQEFSQNPAVKQGA